MNPVTGACYREGEILKRPLLAETLTQIANDGYLAFYNGSLSSSIIQDLKNASNGKIVQYTYYYKICVTIHNKGVR